MNKFHGRNSFRRNNPLYFAIVRVFPIVQVDDHSTNAVYAINLVLYCRVGKWLKRSDTNSEAASSSLTCGAFFLKNKVFKYFSTSFPCKVKLSFYPNNYLTSADPEGGDRGSGPPPGKPQVIRVSIGNKQLDPLEKNWTPWKMLDPLWNLEK